MRTIWKFPLETQDRQFVPMPAGATLLSVQCQHDAPQLWALVDQNPNAFLVERRINIYGTGHPVTEGGIFVGTYQLMDGALVFHVFDQGEV